jgi:hypothetical protein
MQRAVRTPAHIAIWATLFDKGIPYLEKAIQLGEEHARWTLAVIYIERGEAKAYPENAVATKRVSVLESGPLRVNTHRFHVDKN